MESSPFRHWNFLLDQIETSLVCDFETLQDFQGRCGDQKLEKLKFSELVEKLSKIEKDSDVLVRIPNKTSNDNTKVHSDARKDKKKKNEKETQSAKKRNNASPPKTKALQNQSKIIEQINEPVKETQIAIKPKGSEKTSKESKEENKDNKKENNNKAKEINSKSEPNSKKTSTKENIEAKQLKPIGEKPAESSSKLKKPDSQKKNQGPKSKKAKQETDSNTSAKDKPTDSKSETSRISVNKNSSKLPVASIDNLSSVSQKRNNVSSESNGKKKSDKKPLPNIQFSRVKFGDSENIIKNPTSGKDYKTMLKRAKEFKNSVDDLKKEDLEQGQAKEKKDLISKAIKKASGVKIKDDIEKLKKAAKNKARQKQKSKDRAEKLEKNLTKKKAENQKKRAENIAKRKKGAKKK